MIFFRRFLFVFSAAAGLLLPWKSNAQQDPVKLEPVTIKGFAPESFMSGLKIQRIDSASLQQFRFQNIGDLLAFQTPIAFKNYGPGQLSTASFRGTSANHTAVLWNGLNINSPLLGQTDFSTIPVAAFDQLSVQYGSAASIVGTDAVGGSILLGSGPPAEHTSAFIARRFDSFLNFQGQTGATYGAPAGSSHYFSGKTSISGSQTNNRFPALKRNGYALLPSETLQLGLVQDLFLVSKDDRELSAHVWLAKNKLVLTPDEVAGKELTDTQAYRTMLRYRVRDFVFRTSWVRDIIDYAKGDFSNPDHSVSDRFSNRVEKDFVWTAGRIPDNLNIKVGGEWSYYRAKVPGYEDNAISENRADIFLLTRWQILNRLLLSANIRQAFVTRYSPPVTPSAGLEYQILKNNTHILTLRSSVGASYRVPTLNERFWKELGNPEIRPEHGWNKEVGMDYKFLANARHTVRLSAAAYQNRVRDWTYWNPSRNYRVENLQQVLTKGIELQASMQSNSLLVNYGVTAGYALNRSFQEKAYDAYSADVVGKQLVFVPLHSGNLNAFIAYKNSRITVQGMALSRRYSTFDNSQHLDGYGLLNLLAGHTFMIGAVKINASGQVNNLTNAFYLNVRNYAMPGRSYALSISANYMSKSKIKHFL